MKLEKRTLGQWASAFFAALLVIVLVPSVALPARAQGVSPVANVYQLELKVAKDGQTLLTPKSTVVMGRQFQLTVFKKDNADGAIRLQLTASPGERTAAGERTVVVTGTVLEQMGGAWVVAAEPRLRMKEGADASISVPGPIGRIDLSIKATPKYDKRALSAREMKCPSVDGPITTMDTCPQCDSLPCPQCKNCCSAPCQDGSGYELRCCNTLECCACGTCCSPPQ